ncbi:hypothetical protein C5167_048020 [Papaver somniferum]|uniref:Uncharacterized protein n=1 Tax=Papaver somniferum TaxID=3469 RepID=A0A4Y7KGR1_PAPSO|nr:hypothetical protein C5167_048020 [Papaver somniferum]
MQDLDGQILLICKGASSFHIVEFVRTGNDIIGREPVANNFYKRDLKSATFARLTTVHTSLLLRKGIDRLSKKSNMV